MKKLSSYAAKALIGRISEELKSCPFCGCKDVRLMESECGTMFAFRCLNGCAKQFWGASREGAVERWNRREPS